MNTPTLPPSTPNSKLTWPEVAMGFVRELTGLVVMCIVGILALKGEAKATEVVMTAFGIFTYKSSPPPDMRSGVRSAIPMAIIGGIFVLSHLSACATTNAADQQRLIEYTAEQQACLTSELGQLDLGLETKEQANQNATACRNRVKAAYGRLDAGGE